jgi:hypothetical protein
MRPEAMACAGLIADEPSGTLAAVASPLPRAVIAVALALASSACVTVQPHQRQVLAQPEMDPATDTLEETFHSHIESAREGSFGGHRASGGGCGCG